MYLIIKEHILVEIIISNAPIYLNTFCRTTSITQSSHIYLMELLEQEKAVSLKLLAERNIVTYNCSAFFIDVRGEYTKLVQKLGGKTIKIRQR